MQLGQQTWEFQNNPVIIASSAIGGPFEAQGALAEDFDLLNDDLWIGEDSFEKAQVRLSEQAIEKILEKTRLTKKDIGCIVSGDLVNQITASTFAARTYERPYLGIFGACSTSMEGLALASLIVDSRSSDYVIAETSSHNAATEKQFRYPTEYGVQKPPTAQWTVTGAGAALVAQKGKGPKVTTATIGQIVDAGITDPYDMGSAMAPAAVNTILAHFKDRGIAPSYYDLIITGDLGSVGYPIAHELLGKKGLKISSEIFVDCGMLIYTEDQSVIAGGSGCACSAVVTYGHFLNRMRKGKLKKILVVATGALLSPLTQKQAETIPCIAHAVSIEMEEN